ncbi:hypothetical protein [Bacteroides ovatus]|uniref:Uncharacterized protein n=1 Tax=Bacteroides ovatus TaxID=28116 RepID=A0A1G8RY72_BACOV|nr:hypothetical protein [Bacteroides ovatus]SDJ21505.1 hypothetical protein SAMN05192582_11632 [Bacteroides ovatus]
MSIHRIYLKQVSLFLAVLSLFIHINCTGDLRPELQKMLEDYKNHMPFDSVGDLSQLKLVDYAYKGTATSPKEKLTLVEAIFSDQSPFSFSTTVFERDTVVTKTDTIITENRYPKFEILSVSKLLSVGKVTADSLSTLKQIAKQSILNDREPIVYVDLDWCYKGKMYHSIGIISKDKREEFYLSDLMTISLRTGDTTWTKSVRKKSKKNCYKKAF